MKTAISVPDEIFHKAEQVAERLGWSRSQLYAHAVSEFLQRQGEDPVTVALDALVDVSKSDQAPAAGRALIDSGMWEW